MICYFVVYTYWDEDGNSGKGSCGIYTKNKLNTLSSIRKLEKDIVKEVDDIEKVTIENWKRIRGE